MTRIALLGALFALAGCATTKAPDSAWQRYDAGRTPSSEHTHGCVPKVGPNCHNKIMWHCAQGFVDGCNSEGSTGKHTCRPARAE